MPLERVIILKRKPTKPLRVPNTRATVRDLSDLRVIRVFRRPSLLGRVCGALRGQRFAE